MFLGNYLQVGWIGWQCGVRSERVLSTNHRFDGLVASLSYEARYSSAQQPGTARFETIPNLALLDLKLSHRETCGCMGLGYYILNGAWIKMLHIGQEATIACLILHYCGPLWFKEGGYFPETSLQGHECFNSNICRAWLGFNAVHR